MAVLVAHRYARERDRFEKLMLRVAQMCRQEIVEANAIRAAVTGRTKDVGRLEAKVARRMLDASWPNDLQVEDAFARLGDLAAVRVSTYVEADRQRVVDLVQSTFVGPDGGPVTAEVKDRFDVVTGHFYRATHLDVALPEEELIGSFDNVRGVRCEVQVCSMLAHVWNEIEHDLVYKPLMGPISVEEREALNALGHLTVAADLVLRNLYEATNRRQERQQGNFVDVYDFVGRVRQRFPTAERFGDHAGQLFEEMNAAAIRSPEQLEAIMGVDADARAERRIAAYVGVTAGDDRAPALDPSSSDRLMALFLDEHAEAVALRHPTGRGLGRPPRIASVARRWSEVSEDLDRTVSV